MVYKSLRMFHASLAHAPRSATESLRPGGTVEQGSGRSMQLVPVMQNPRFVDTMLYARFESIHHSTSPIRDTQTLILATSGPLCVRPSTCQGKQ